MMRGPRYYRIELTHNYRFAWVSLNSWAEYGAGTILIYATDRYDGKHGKHGKHPKYVSSCVLHLPPCYHAMELHCNFDLVFEEIKHSKFGIRVSWPTVQKLMGIPSYTVHSIVHRNASINCRRLTELKLMVLIIVNKPQ